MKEKDSVAIIGAGPAGLSCALYLLRAGINPTIFEKNTPGGVLNETTKIENYPGFTEKNASILAFRMYSMLEELDANIVTKEILSIEENNKNYLVKTKDKDYEFKYIVIATGRSPKKLPIDKADKYIGRGISYCAICDGALYKNKDIAIVGSGPSAVEAALYLSNIANKIYMINRGNLFKAEQKEKESLFKLNNIEIIYNSNIESLIINEDKVNGIYLDVKRKIDISCVFVFIGQVSNSLYYQSLNLESDKKGIIVDENMKTSKNNIYATGDSISKNLYQVITAASDGAVAANSIIRQING